MKTPRVTDFDPDAKVPPLKSPLEGMPVIGKPSRSTPQHTPAAETDNVGNESPTQSVPDRATARPGDEPTTRRTDRPTGRRILVRRGFEWFEDQLAELKNLSLREQMEGKSGSMSAMLREALDDYLKKRAAQK